VREYVRKQFLLLSFIAGVHNVIKKCDTIEDEESCKKTKYIRGNDGGFNGKTG
jgi:F0F1-type ATP synthase assembly protein I